MPLTAVLNASHWSLHVSDRLTNACQSMSARSFSRLLVSRSLQFLPDLYVGLSSSSFDLELHDDLQMVGRVAAVLHIPLDARVTFCVRVRHQDVVQDGVRVVAVEGWSVDQQPEAIFLQILQSDGPSRVC